jgi:glutathione S-transferase
MSELILYHAPGACARVSLNALEECELDYELRMLNMAKGEQKSASYKAVNPKGKVPALVVDKHLLTENAAILSYLHARIPTAELLPATSDPFIGASHLSDVIWCSATVHPMVRQIRMPIRYTDGETDGIRAKGIEYFSDVMTIVDKRLSDSQWWYGQAHRETAAVDAAGFELLRGFTLV